MPPLTAVSIVVDDRKVRAMLGQYTGAQMTTRLRRGTRAGVAVYRAALRARARSDSSVPDFFSKTRTRHSASMRSGIYSSVRPTSPLTSVFESGASAHDIGSRRTFLLAGPAGQRWRSRDFRARGSVRHPGMDAHPILAPVFEQATGAAKRAAATAVFGDQAVGLLGMGE